MKTLPRLAFTAVLLATSLASAGQTIGGIAVPAFHWRCASGDASINYNHAVIAASGEGIVFDSLPYSPGYTVIAVYKPLSSTETRVWGMDFGDAPDSAGGQGRRIRGLTTEHIQCGGAIARYAVTTEPMPAISTLRQPAPDSVTPWVRLTVGGSGGMKVSEVLYYPYRLGNAALRVMQGLLAIRYGVTLGPVDYLDGWGRHVWEYGGGRYHHRVTGVGADTVTGLRQLRSRSEMDGAVLTLSADSLESGTFLVAGDDDAPMSFVWDGGAEMLGRTWKIRSTSAEGCRFSLTFDLHGAASPGDSLALLIDGCIHLPSAHAGDSVRFDGVEFPSDSAILTVGRGGVLWRLAQSGGGKGHGADNATGWEADAQGNGFSASIHPNPTIGHYTIHVTGAGNVRVTVYDAKGIAVAAYTDSGRERYRFEGTLPASGVYYADIETDNGSQTLKLVVK